MNHDLNLEHNVSPASFVGHTYKHSQDQTASDSPTHPFLCLLSYKNKPELDHLITFKVSPGSKEPLLSSL